MPELSRFKGIVIKMYYDDVSQHYKPHVHVFYGDEEAVVGLDGEVLSGKLPLRQYRMVSGSPCMRQRLIAHGTSPSRRSPSRRSSRSHNPGGAKCLYRRDTCAPVSPPTT